MKLAIYTDDAPISENYFAYGMSRVNRRLFLSLNEYICIITNTQHHMYFIKSMLEKELISKTRTFLYPRIFLKVFKLVNIVSNKLFNINIDILFFLEKNKISKDILMSGADYLFVPLGSDIKSYTRAILLAKRTKLNLIVYIVDEFYSSSILSNDSYAKEFIDKKMNFYLNSTFKIFVISPGMQEYYKTKFGINSQVLPLPFQEPTILLEDRKDTNEILFLGSVSHFYKDGINDILEVIRLSNKTNEIQLKLRLTLNEIPNFIDNCHKDLISIGRVEGEVGLANLIKNSLFAFIPYSFDNKFKTMVSTSFPSKTLECMSYSKRILIYGPSYSTSAVYFKQRNLPTVIEERNLTLLKEYIDDSINNNLENVNYNKIVIDEHGFDNIKNIILSELS